MNSEKAYYERLEIQNKILEDKYKQVLEVAQERFDRIQKAIVEIENFYNPNSTKQEIIYVSNLFLGKILDILKGSKNE